MPDSTSISKSHDAQDALIRVATNEIGDFPDDRGESDSNSSKQASHDDEKGKGEDVEAQVSEKPSPVNEKTNLQDQTNLLPLKQLLVVFAGCSCALFCKCFSLFSSLQH
jgi:hypothetical protein